jgi:hypothetical protein
MMRRALGLLICFNRATVHESWRGSRRAGNYYRCLESILKEEDWSTPPYSGDNIYQVENERERKAAGWDPPPSALTPMYSSPSRLLLHYRTLPRCRYHYWPTARTTRRTTWSGRGSCRSPRSAWSHSSTTRSVRSWSPPRSRSRGLSRPLCSCPSRCSSHCPRP